MNDNPIVIETERLILKAFHISEAPYFYELNSNPNVLKYTGDVAFKSVSEAEHFIVHYDHYQTFGFGRWSVIEKSQSQFLGWCGLKRIDTETDIGFRFFEHEWNKGYATESAKACLEYGFDILKLEKIIARASLQNISSLKVINKLSLRYWKTEDYDGIPETHFYYLTKKMFNNAR